MNHDLFRNLFDRAYDSAMNDEDTVFGANKRIQELLVLEANKKEMEKVMWKTFPGYTEASLQCKPHVASWIFLNGINIVCLKCHSRIDPTEIGLSQESARERRRKHRKPRWKRGHNPSRQSRRKVAFKPPRKKKRKSLFFTIGQSNLFGL